MPEELRKLSLPPDLYSRNNVLSHIINKLNIWPKVRVLDVGGYGGHLNWFLRPSEELKYYVLDQKPRPETEDTIYVQGDARKLPFSDKNFDFVIASDLFEHTKDEDREKILSELLRVTKNHLIMGMPVSSNLNQKAEDLIRKQFQNNSGTAHPFLSEHKHFGLPEEQKMIDLINKHNLNFSVIREGNLMNWYISQLYNGASQGEVLPKEKILKYNQFFNQNLFELGNLRPPQYRSIFIITKNGEAQITEIEEDLNQKFAWNAEKFVELLGICFDDMRLILDNRKDQIANSLQELKLTKNHANNLEGIVNVARKSVEAHKEGLKELRNILAEKEQAINFIKALLQNKDEIISKLTVNLVSLQEEITRNESFLNKLQEDLVLKTKELDFLRTNKTQIESTLQQKDQEIIALTNDLESHRKSLREIMNSRAWKVVMFYGNIKQKVITKPFSQIQKASHIIKSFGIKAFIQRLNRKLLKDKNGILPPTSGDYNSFVLSQKYSTREVKSIKEEIERFDYRPIISIVMPVYNVEEKWLKKAIDSVISQYYGRFELCITDDASTQPHIKEILEHYHKVDGRIKVSYRQKNGGIVKTSNDALRLATGAYVALLDNDDELTQDALYEVVKSLQETRYDLIYSDEDKIEMNGKYSDPFYKPDFSPDLLLSINYISHLGIYKKKIINELGGFRDGFDGSQDYDLVLRFTEKTNSIKHIPKVLYHWRKVPGSTAALAEAKPYAFESAKKALTQALKRRNITGNITDGIWAGSYRLKRNVLGAPKVSVIIPFKDKVEVTKVCVTSILTRTGYPNYELLLVDNNSELLETSDYLKKLSVENHHNPDGSPRIKILEYKKPFNYSAINNFGAQNATGDYLILLNNDTEVIEPLWIESLLEHAQRPEVGVVGAKLLYPNNLIQHGGVVVGLGGVANHAFCKLTSDDHGYFGMADLTRNCSAVTFACVMLRKDVYQKMNGLDEQNLAVAFNDVDFCLRLREAGYLVVYTPYAVLYHHESLTRGFKVALNEIEYMRRRHCTILDKGDPYYNPNLTRERLDFSLKIADRVK